MGYSAEQIRDLELTINGAEGDLVLFATPIQLTRILKSTSRRSASAMNTATTETRRA